MISLASFPHDWMEDYRIVYSFEQIELFILFITWEIPNYFFSSWELETRKLRANRTICSLEAHAKSNYCLRNLETLIQELRASEIILLKAQEKSNYLFKLLITWEILNYLLSCRNLESREQIELFIHLRLKSKLFITWEISNCASSVVKVLSGSCRHWAGEPRPFGQKKKKRRLRQDPLEANLVIFVRRALIFFVWLKALGKKWKMTPFLCACAVVITLETQMSKKGTSLRQIKLKYIWKGRTNLW